ncbi:DUF2314 domain-containing protein [Cellulophaga omnivescoria]|uniref:DUF2314 domain-containing protein n=1 Tax=Cellulophaga omnivescoria TaxID=1888890 RepID=UPI000985F641|nr:DUF2314 domain-containing protein [Cellulophaga omnivescoria]WBU90601.1 DUF2314 domain-containing protein [Cellulophaga omnivescoria]WKB82723.1 DUF2314 domain-containing protein [Cellulophaga lytica]
MSNSDNNIFFAKQDDEMSLAFKKAQETFKYFWREMYWEYRRVIPGLDLAIVKFPFEQTFKGESEPTIEHMWVRNISFDGENITGVLANNPMQLTNVTEGDTVSCSRSKISDWMFATLGKTYGGFTIHTLRSGMSDEKRKQHDNAWGLDFGDFNKIMLVNGQAENPENLVEHPMCVNTADKFLEFFKENPEELTTKDEAGYTVLHRQAIAGNKTTVNILLELGADKNATTNNGLTALDYAKKLNWSHIISSLA